MSFVSAVLWVLVAILIVYCLTTYLNPRNKCYTTDVTESSYDEVFKTRDSCSLVYHPQCQHCKTMIPHYLKSSKLMPSIKFFKINAAQHNIPSNITGFPTIIVRKNGNEIGRIVGAQPTSRNIISKIKSLMKNQPTQKYTMKPTEQSTEQPTEQLMDKPKDKPKDEPKDKPKDSQQPTVAESISHDSNPVLLAQRYHFSVGRTPFV